MPQKSNTGVAQGTGTIRKKTVTRNGKQYTFWEARYTAGRDPGTGKQVQHSITEKTQKEATQKLKAATAAFTLDAYGHAAEQMKQKSVRRMEGYIKRVLNL